MTEFAICVQCRVTSFIIFLNVAALKQKEKSLYLWNFLKNTTHKNTMIFLMFRNIISFSVSLNFVKSF